MNRLLNVLFSSGLGAVLLLNAFFVDCAAGEAVPSLAAYLPPWMYVGDEVGGLLGQAVGGAGDVNGDGYADVVVGAPKSTENVDREGAIRVFYGTARGLEPLPAWTAGSGKKGSAFGWSVSTAGNVNGDQYDDIIVGAPDYNNGTYKVGKVFVYYGRKDTGELFREPDWTYEGVYKEGLLGWSVTSAGDVNQDGYDDVVVGSPKYTGGEGSQEYSEGALFGFYGSKDGLSESPDWVFEGNRSEAQVGRAVSAAGDVNHDGYADLIAGLPYDDSSGENTGAAYIFHGSATGLSDTPDWIYTGDQENAWFGYSVGPAGDLNGDGCDDIVVGAPKNVESDLAMGAAFVYLGSGSGVSKNPIWTLRNGQPDSWFGISVGTGGDVNHDGYDDLLIGAHRYDGGQSNEGRAELYLGSLAGLLAKPNWWAEGNKADALFGSAVGSAGDVNGDGYADLLVGAPEYKKETDIMGSAFAYYGQGVIEAPQYPALYLPLVYRH